VEAKRIEDGKLLMIIIDVSKNVPTWEQFIDVTYDRGRDTNIKIIIFGQELEDGLRQFPAGNALEIKNLVRRSNRCGVVTYLVKGVGAQVVTQKKLFSDYEVYSDPKDVDFNAGEQLPTKRQVQEGEFGVGYYFWNWRCEGGILTFDNIVNGWKPGYSLSHNLEIKALWNEKGFFICLFGDPRSHVIHWIWENRKERLEMKCPDNSIKLKFKDDEPYAISARIFDTSMSELIDMEPHHKWDYGKKVYYKILAYSRIVDEIISDYDEMKEA
jgi:hypothetical protein